MSTIKGDRPPPTMVERISHQVQEQYNRAFYDVIQHSIETKNYDHIVRLYTEIRDRLARMLFNKDGPTYQRLLTDFDVPFFEQRLRNEVFDNRSMMLLVSMTFAWIHDLQMPLRDVSSAAAQERVSASGHTMLELVPAYIREVHGCLDTMEQDMREFYDNRDHPVVQEMLRKAASALPHNK